jgi:H+-translocating NAD(P) transhydrogenase subunit alpha
MTSAIESADTLAVGIPRETAAGERRVSLIPETAGKLVATGLSVVLESGAGASAFHVDATYAESGATVVADAGAVYRAARIVARVRAPSEGEVEVMRSGTFLLSFLDPARDPELVRRMSERGIIAFSFNRIPRTTLAQSMDAMSSMATVAGYKAVLMAADSLPRLFPLLMTAAGTLAPARVLVLGAGVAGLQALATARRLGAITSGFDTRPVVREHVQSVGATFIEMPEATSEETHVEGGYAKDLGAEFYESERAAIRSHVEQSDVIVTTAAIPGKRAPLLIDEEMVASMKPGSVIVDLAAETGGNCTLTAPGDTVTVRGVTIIGLLDVPSMVPQHASQLYSRNVLNVIKYVIKDGKLVLDPNDEIVRSACVTGLEVAT